MNVPLLATPPPRNSNIWSTSDTPLVATLATRGYKHFATAWQSPHRLGFYYYPVSEGLLGIVSDYRAGFARVEPLTFSAIIHHLRREIRAAIEARESAQAETAVSR